MSDRQELFVDGDRAFLNLEGFHGDATVSWELRVDRYSDHVSNDGNFNVRDCSSSVSLSLEWHNEPYLLNSLAKLDALIEQARRCKKSLRDARRVYLQNKGKRA